MEVCFNSILTNKEFLLMKFLYSEFHAGILVRIDSHNYIKMVLDVIFKIKY